MLCHSPQCFHCLFHPHSYSNFFVFCFTVVAITPTPQHQLLACKAAPPLAGFELWQFEHFILGPRELHEGRHPTLKLYESRSTTADDESSFSNFPPFLPRFKIRFVHEAHRPLSVRTESRQKTCWSACSSSSLPVKPFPRILDKFERKLILWFSPAISSSLSPPKLSSQEWSKR